MMEYKICELIFFNIKIAKRSGSVGKVLDWGSKGCWFEPHLWPNHCVVSLSRTLYPLLSTGSHQEDSSRHD